MLDADLIADYATNFFGYGSWDAPIWFVGIEEAGGEKEADVRLRLEQWRERKCRDLEDVYEFYRALGIHKYHGEDPELQSTWAGLFRTLLLARYGECDEAGIKRYQQKQMGELCLVELLALNSPNTKRWKYREWTDVEWLSSRKAYLENVKHSRTAVFKEMIRARHPEAVVFYGTTIPGASLLPSWSRIAGGYFDQGFSDDDILLQRVQEPSATAFFVIRHPTQEAPENLIRIGQHLHKYHGQRFQL